MLRAAGMKPAVRRYVPWLTPDRVSPISFTPLAEMHGIITPLGQHFERHHCGVPDVEPEDYRLMIHGMLESRRAVARALLRSLALPGLALAASPAWT